MASNSSYETLWADQWDYSNPDPHPTATNKKSNGSNGVTQKYGKKMGEGLEKTKDLASTGFKKVMAGASVGFHWIKDKYHKTTGK
ncbi:hypothetical protein RJ641_014440 [Dillenia turbinata]|uniref:CDP-diacylglycerol-glycerol-3-phosphate 3-phosphatidyltransferase n=1 Tax=Dillenia turbinata TaxID=194707 RepID=A0AAN8Z1D4_9MAGN